MASKKSPPQRKQYGRRGDGKTQTTLSLSEEVLEKARRAAEEDGRSLSNFIEQLLKKSLLLLLALFSCWQFAPKTRPALRSCGKAVVALVESTISAATKALAKL